MATCLCKTCGAVMHLSFGTGLSKGWPTCHGETMELQPVSPVEVARGVAQVMDPLHAIRQVLKKGS